MLTHQPLEGEHTRATVLTRPGGTADAGQRAGTVAYGVAGRSYVKSGRSYDPWISSHLELRGHDGELLPGYGWIFPLADGEVNLGVGALATSKRPADLQIRPLMEYYASLRREEWDLSGELRLPTSALLPMGGAV